MSFTSATTSSTACSPRRSGRRDILRDLARPGVRRAQEFVLAARRREQRPEDRPHGDPQGADRERLRLVGAPCLALELARPLLHLVGAVAEVIRLLANERLAAPALVESAFSVAGAQEAITGFRRNREMMDANRKGGDQASADAFSFCPTSSGTRSPMRTRYAATSRGRRAGGDYRHDRERVGKRGGGKRFGRNTASRLHGDVSRRGRVVDARKLRVDHRRSTGIPSGTRVLGWNH
ncbi:MAG: hypothetical protein AB7P02_28910 [Alphaproteobacteria bacterium]